MDGAEDTLVWDDGNLAHLRDRNVDRQATGERQITREEVDALYESADYTTRDVVYLTRQGEWEPQVHLIGRTPEGRFLTVACQVADDGRFRPITVWTSSPTEIALCWKDKEDDD